MQVSYFDMGQYMMCNQHIRIIKTMSVGHGTTREGRIGSFFTV